MNPGWLTTQEGDILERYARNSDIARVLEIGSLYGKSTERIVDGLLKKYALAFKMVCIDPWVYIDRDKAFPGEIFYKRFYDKGVDENIIHMKAMSREVASFIMEREYGFCFIDGDHAALPTMFDMMICSTVTTTLLVHDYHSTTHLDVNKAVDWFISVSGWEKVDQGGSIVVLKGCKTLKMPKYPGVKVPNE